MLAPRNHRVLEGAGCNSALAAWFSRAAAPIAVLTLFLAGCNFTKPIPVDDAFMHASGPTAVAAHQAVPEPRQPEKTAALAASHAEPARQTRLVTPAPVRNTAANSATPASPANSARPASPSPAWSPTLRVSAREKDTPNVAAAVPTTKAPVPETAGNAAVADETQKAVIQIGPKSSQPSPSKRTGLKWWAWTGFAMLFLLLVAGAAALPPIRERIISLIARGGVMFGETQLRFWPRRGLKLGGGFGKNGAAAAAAVVLKGLEVPRKKEEVPKPPSFAEPMEGGPGPSFAKPMEGGPGQGKELAQDVVKEPVKEAVKEAVQEPVVSNQ